MMDYLLTCPCGEIILKSVNGTTKIRNKIVVFAGDSAVAVCKGCNTEHKIPVRLDRVEMIKSLSSQPRLYLRGK